MNKIHKQTAEGWTLVTEIVTKPRKISVAWNALAQRVNSFFLKNLVYCENNYVISDSKSKGCNGLTEREVKILGDINKNDGTCQTTVGYRRMVV